MKLYEEFNEYEKMWDSSSKDTLQEEQTIDPVDEILKTYDDFEFDYDGWTEDGFEDHFNPFSSYGHYQTSKTYNYDDFTYKIGAVDMFELLVDFLPKIVKIKKNYDSDSEVELINEYKKLEQAWMDSSKEEEESTGRALDLFIAENLEALVNTFYYELQNHCKDDAYEWAGDNLEVN
jgi:hypothetical protein